MKNPEKFRFIQFSVEHSRSAMKVGTDAILLGTWINPKKARNILDIGTGCGIISLMLAQRSTAEIYAIDIDENSTNEALMNFSNSPWSSRLHVFNQSLTDFAKNCDLKYDLIVSNPPFFQSDLLPASKKLQIAKHATTLDFESFIQNAKQLLHEKGLLAVILPYTGSNIFSKKCLTENLYPAQELKIVPKDKKKENRLILVFSRQKAQSPESSVLVVRDKNGEYTPDYKNLTSAFHPPQHFNKSG